MKKIIRMIVFVLVSSFSSVWAEPGGTYTLTGKEQGITEIIKADMARYPELYKGESLNSYLFKFKSENKIGRKKYKLGDQLRFPHTLTSLRLKSAKPNSLPQSSVAQEERTTKSNELPDTFKLRGLASIVQEGAYCVPASGEVIAKFHDIKTDQWEIARLSSQNSMDNSGTNPEDMARALENFGIRFHRVEYKHAPGNVDDFIKKTLPQFKEALVNEGPMYISIREIFGGNHGCVVIGYNDTREKMYFYNPWGDEFNLSYKEVAKYSYRAIAFTPPKQMDHKTVDCTSLIESLKQVLPNTEQNVIELRNTLEKAGISYEFIECNRHDTMNDVDKTERLARHEGQKFLELALERVPAILIPQTDKEGVTDYMLIRKSPESEKKLLVQRIGSRGWETQEPSKASLLVRYWTTPVNVTGKKQWLLPLFEFSGTTEQ